MNKEVRIIINILLIVLSAMLLASCSSVQHGKSRVFKIQTMQDKTIQKEWIVNSFKYEGCGVAFFYKGKYHYEPNVRIIEL